jgi:phage baseplate assembly protein W
MATDKTLQNVIHSDFSNNLTPHPARKDLIALNNERAVTNSIKNLILTNRGERLYQPNIGSDINKLLFEPMSDAVVASLKSFIFATIDAYEPRAKIIDITAEPDFDNNGYDVTIRYVLINNSTPAAVNIKLNRVR